MILCNLYFAFDNGRNRYKIRKWLSPNIIESGRFCRSLLAGEWLRSPVFVRLQAGFYKEPILHSTALGLAGATDRSSPAGSWKPLPALGKRAWLPAISGSVCRSPALTPRDPAGARRV